MTKRRLESILGRAANDAEIASELGLSLASYQTFSAGAAVSPTVSLDAPTTGGRMLEVTDLAETPADERLVREQSMVGHDAAKRAVTMRRNGWSRSREIRAEPRVAASPTASGR